MKQHKDLVMGLGVLTVAIVAYFVGRSELAHLCLGMAIGILLYGDI